MTEEIKTPAVAEEIVKESGYSENQIQVLE